jgi:predicted esterase YcpF (UPF0227 family)
MSADNEAARAGPVHPKPTLVYLHGFNSSAQSAKGQQLARAAAALAQPPCLHLPSLPHRPALAIREVRAWIDAQSRDANGLTLVGSSLGGYYATWLAESYGARAVLINPAIRPCDDLRPYLGRQRNLHTGEEYDVTPEHLAELAALRVTRITRPQRYFLLVRTGDELLDWREAVEFYGGAFQYVAGGGDHGWADFGDELASVLRFAGCRA